MVFQIYFIFRKYPNTSGGGCTYIHTRTYFLKPPKREGNNFISWATYVAGGNFSPRAPLVSHRWHFSLYKRKLLAPFIITTTLLSSVFVPFFAPFSLVATAPATATMFLTAVRCHDESRTKRPFLSYDLILTRATCYERNFCKRLLPRASSRTYNDLSLLPFSHPRNLRKKKKKKRNVACYVLFLSLSYSPTVLSFPNGPSLFPTEIDVSPARRCLLNNHGKRVILITLNVRSNVCRPFQPLCSRPTDWILFARIFSTKEERKKKGQRYRGVSRHRFSTGLSHLVVGGYFISVVERISGTRERSLFHFV